MPSFCIYQGLHRAHWQGLGSLCLSLLFFFAQVVSVPCQPDTAPRDPGGDWLSGDAGCDVLQHLDLPGCDCGLHSGLLCGLPNAQYAVEAPGPAAFKDTVARTRAASPMGGWRLIFHWRNYSWPLMLERFPGH